VAEQLWAPAQLEMTAPAQYNTHCNSQAAQLPSSVLGRPPFALQLQFSCQRSLSYLVAEGGDPKTCCHVGSHATLTPRQTHNQRPPPREHPPSQVTTPCLRPPQQHPACVPVLPAPGSSPVVQQSGCCPSQAHQVEPAAHRQTLTIASGGHALLGHSSHVPHGYYGTAAAYWAGSTHKKGQALIAASGSQVHCCCDSSVCSTRQQLTGQQAQHADGGQRKVGLQ
jgi:hypothetical protein